MAWSRAAVAFLFLALAGAGCLSSDDPPVSPEGPAATGLGTIEGVVVTPAIAPLRGVAVRLAPGDANATTDASGSFRFAGLDAGDYTLSVQASGYLPQTLAATTGHGLVQVVLEPDTGSLAYVQAEVFEGFVDSSVNVAGARSSNSDAPTYEFPGRVPDFIQIEMVWESTQALGANMDLTLIADDGGTVLPVAGRGEGPSPLAVTLDAATIAEAGFGPDVALDLAVFVGREPVAGDDGAGLALQQRFTLFTHMFYGYAPPEGWRFSADGEAPPPTE